ncbi:MAG: Rdx family protein [Anaerolineales bacterium]|nr:Rdx family protein [Anaerolineales bacterium]
MDRAAGLAADILKEFEPEIETLTLVPSDGGRFEVALEGDLVYSKLETRRHAEPGEVVGLIHKKLST